jgi:hypothetical protein
VLRDILIFGIDYCAEIAIRIILDVTLSGYSGISLVMQMKVVLGEKVWNVTHADDAFRKHFVCKSARI